MRRALDCCLWALLGCFVVTSGLWVRPAIVGGGSMEPALVRGDVCVALAGASVREGDVVLFRDEEGLVLHRVVRVEQRGALRTKGDANATVDRRPVPLDQVCGRVAFVLPLGRVLAGWMPRSRGATLQNQSQSEAMTERRPGTWSAAQGETPMTARVSGGSRAVHSISRELNGPLRPSRGAGAPDIGPVSL